MTLDAVEQSPTWCAPAGTSFNDRSFVLP